MMFADTKEKPRSCHVFRAWLHYDIYLAIVYAVMGGPLNSVDMRSLYCLETCVTGILTCYRVGLLGEAW